MSFEKSLAFGRLFESDIAHALGGHLVGLSEQKLGYDILFEGVKVECKHDLRAMTTGNFYAEIGTGVKAGCLITSTADYIVVKIGHSNDVWVFKPSDFRDNLPKLMTMFRQAGTRNSNGYQSRGLLIPLTKMGLFAKLVNISQLKDFLTK